MLVNLDYVLKDAQEHKYGVGLFNTTDTDMLEAVISAAEELNSPVIIGTAEVLLPYGELKLIAPAMIAAAKRAKVPVVVHYDHGLTCNYICNKRVSTKTDNKCKHAHRGNKCARVYANCLQNKENNCNCTSVFYKAVKECQNCFRAVVTLHNSGENKSDNAANSVNNYDFNKANYNVKRV